MTRNGMLVVNKPIGMVCKDLSRWLIRRVGKIKLGHVGTLDPIAEGVVVLLCGKATPLQDYLLGLPKTYECTMELGYATDTLDSDGEVVQRDPWDHVTVEAVHAAVSNFVGSIVQIPPLYSAVKHKGRPLYSYARSGQELPIDIQQLGRTVEVFSFEITKCELPRISFRVRCSKGTYIRVLARDLATKLGTCGTVIALCRSEASGFTIDQALTLERLEEKLEASADWMISLEDARVQIPRLGLSADEIRRLFNGGSIVVERTRLPLANVPASMVELPLLAMDSSGKACAYAAATGLDLSAIKVKLKRSLA